MRIWSLNPRYLDSKGLVAFWREALLAQRCLLMGEGGYSKHPQLDRFKLSIDPLGAICNVLWIVAIEAYSRDYNFNTDKIHEEWQPDLMLPVNRGQVEYEVEHLLKKLLVRDPAIADQLEDASNINLESVLSPCFIMVPGGIEGWEKT